MISLMAEVVPESAQQPAEGQNRLPTWGGPIAVSAAGTHINTDLSEGRKSAGHVITGSDKGGQFASRVL